MGYDTTAGRLAGGFPAWFRAARPVAATGACTVQGLRERLTREKPFLLDVRDRKNREHVGYIPGSKHVYVGELPQHLQDSRRTGLLSYTAIPGTRGALRRACSLCTVSLM